MTGCTFSFVVFRAAAVALGAVNALKAYAVLLWLSLAWMMLL